MMSRNQIKILKVPKTFLLVTAQVATSDGLIPSTAPSERTKAIKPGRDNPFAVIPIQPVVRQINQIVNGNS
jgi:hypothetical protein